MCNTYQGASKELLEAAVKGSAGVALGVSPPALAARRSASRALAPGVSCTLTISNSGLSD